MQLRLQVQVLQPTGAKIPLVLLLFIQSLVQNTLFLLQAAFVLLSSLKMSTNIKAANAVSSHISRHSCLHFRLTRAHGQGHRLVLWESGNGVSMFTNKFQPFNSMLHGATADETCFSEKFQRVTATLDIGIVRNLAVSLVTEHVTIIIKLENDRQTVLIAY